jgi:hypothetical protein
MTGITVRAVRRRTLGVMMTVGVMLMALAFASPALATPTGEYAVFAQCPLSNSSLNACIAAKTETGEFVVGKEKVPISKAITLQGGFIENEVTEALTFVGRGQRRNAVENTAGSSRRSRRPDRLQRNQQLPGAHCV